MFSFQKKTGFKERYFFLPHKFEKNDKSEKWWKVMKSDSSLFITFHHFFITFHFLHFFCKNIFCVSRKQKLYKKNIVINDNILFQGMNQRQRLQMRSLWNLVSFKQKNNCVKLGLPTKKSTGDLGENGSFPKMNLNGWVGWSLVLPPKKKLTWGVGWSWVLPQKKLTVELGEGGSLAKINFNWWVG